MYVSDQKTDKTGETGSREQRMSRVDETKLIKRSIPFIEISGEW